MAPQQPHLTQTEAKRFIGIAFPKARHMLCRQPKSTHACGAAIAKGLGRKMLEAVRPGRDLLNLTLLEYTIETEWTRELALGFWGRARDLRSQFAPLGAMVSTMSVGDGKAGACVASVAAELGACENRLETIADAWYGTFLELPLDVPWTLKNDKVKRICHEKFLEVHGLIESLACDGDSPLRAAEAALESAFVSLDSDWNSDREGLRDCS
jgi:hypothetical protein